MVLVRAIKRMDIVMSPLIVRMRSLMMQGPTAPLDDHQGTILEPLSIILAYPLIIHRVLATLGRYPNLMEPTFQVEELDGGVFDGGESRTLDYCEQGY
jgi:hypothetical protein